MLRVLWRLRRTQSSSVDCTPLPARLLRAQRWTLRDQDGGDFSMTQAAHCGIPTGSRIASVTCSILWAWQCGNHASAVPPSRRTAGPGRSRVNPRLGVCRILRERGAGSRRSFVPSCTHHVIPAPSPAFWRPAVHRTGPFHGQLLHLRVASRGRYARRTHRLLRTGEGVFHPFHHCASWRSEFAAPLADGFVRHDHATDEEEFFDIPVLRQKRKYSHTA
jgi:hypothetical protein